MKKTVFGVALFFLWVVNGHGQVMESVQVVTGEWGPYVSSELEGYGVVTEIVTAVLHDMDKHPEYLFLQFYKCYELVKENKYQGAFPFHEVDDRKDDVFFSDSLMDVNYVLFYNKILHKEYQDIQRPDGLKGKKIAVVKGYPKNYSYGRKFRGLIDAMSPVVAESELKAFRMLESGEVDLVPSEERVGTKIIRGGFVQDKYGILPGFFSRESARFIVSKTDENRQFLDRFNDSLKKIIDGGVRDAIIQKNYDPILKLFAGEKQTGVVRLRATGSFPLILGRQKHTRNGAQRKDSPAFLVPNGSHAIVVEWSNKFWEAGTFDIHDQMFAESLVKLLEGPLKGESIWVKNLHIEFE